MLNVDWFQVFKHSSYSIGMIYLVIQNLPRELRYKPENILIVSPKLMINSYLKPMVDELLNLWKGVQLKCNNSILGYRTIRVAIGLICSDIPATRKLVGFVDLMPCMRWKERSPKPFLLENQLTFQALKGIIGLPEILKRIIKGYYQYKCS